MPRPKPPADPDLLLQQTCRILRSMLRNGERKPKTPEAMKERLLARSQIVDIGNLLLRIQTRLAPVPTEKELAAMTDEQLDEAARKMR